MREWSGTIECRGSCNVLSRVGKREEIVLEISSQLLGEILRRVAGSSGTCTCSSEGREKVCQFDAIDDAKDWSAIEWSTDFWLLWYVVYR